MPEPTIAPADSILISMKNLLGQGADFHAFDLDLVLHINSVFSSLNQLRVGADPSFFITDETAKWSDFIGETTDIQDVKTYMYFRLRLIFDPPSTSFAIDSIQKQIDKLEFHLNVVEENKKTPPSLIPTPST